MRPAAAVSVLPPFPWSVPDRRYWLIGAVLLAGMWGATVQARPAPVLPSAPAWPSLERDLERLGLYHRHYRRGWQAYRRGDYADAVRVWTALARLGHADAQFRLGLMLDHGMGVERDRRRAVYWFRRAAYQGHVDACYVLGVAYARGHGVAPDMRRAVAWWRLAGARGNVDAQFNLGLVFARGYGDLAARPREAARWFRRAARRGDPWAQYHLGLMYANGIGVTRDRLQAHRWWRAAARQGLAEAARLLEGLQAAADP